jgi:signal transduction histidine kinase
VAIEDIYQDPRIPADAYRPTFVKSLVMVPVRQESPVAAIGNYWAHQHKPTAEEIGLIQALADATSVELENVAVYNELEHRVRDRTAALEAANRDLEAFSFSVSHDLRSPVAQVIGFAELLKDQLEAAAPGALPPKSLPFVDHIYDAAGRMNELIEDLLRLSRVARSELQRRPIELGDLARETRARLEMREPERQVEWHIPEGLVAEADHSLLAVVIENLLANAFKYSSKTNGARIEVGATTAGTGGIAFFVRDNGAGFDPRDAIRLFTPFGRLHPQSEFPGTGVGLATCQRIIHRHGGQMWAEGQPGQGATFYFTLPPG